MLPCSKWMGFKGQVNPSEKTKIAFSQILSFSLSEPLPIEETLTCDRGAAFSVSVCLVARNEGVFRFIGFRASKVKRKSGDQPVLFQPFRALLLTLFVEASPYGHFYANSKIGVVQLGKGKS